MTDTLHPAPSDSTERPAYVPVDTLPPNAGRKRLRGGHRVRFLATCILGALLALLVIAGFVVEGVNAASAENYSATIDASSDRVAAATESLASAPEAEKDAARAALDEATTANADLVANIASPLQLDASYVWWTLGGVALLFVLNRAWRPATYADDEDDA